jgi:hypothetical protein
MVARTNGQAVRRSSRPLADFIIEWASSGFRDPAGRPAADITGRRLLEVYPEAARAGGLFDAADHLLASAPSDTGDDTCLVAVRIR